MDSFGDSDKGCYFKFWDQELIDIFKTTQLTHIFRALEFFMISNKSRKFRTLCHGTLTITVNLINMLCMAFARPVYAEAAGAAGAT